jgi:hypothetical protein
MTVDLRKQSKGAYVSVGSAASIILLLPYRDIIGYVPKDPSKGNVWIL